MSHPQSPDQTSEAELEQPIIDHSADFDEENDQFNESELTRKPRTQWRRWLGILGAIAILGGLGFLGWQWWNARNNVEPAAAQSGPQAVPVKLQTVETSTIVESSQFVGSLDAQQGIILQPKTAGRVTQILVSSGDRVAAGTPMVQLSAEKSRADLNAAIANVNGTRAARENAGAELAALEAERGSALAELELQNEQFERISLLVSRGALAQQELDVVERDRQSARAALNAAEKRISAARAGLDQANAAFQQAEAQAASTREDLQDTRVVAPIAGIVGDIAVNLGDYVSIGDTLTTITQNQALELDISVPSDRADQLQAGLPVELSRFQQDDSPIVTGQISFVSPQANADTQTITAKAIFPNPEGRLKDGQKVSVEVIWDQRPGVLIPTTAISRIAGRTFVFVAQSQEESAPEQPQLIAQQKPVELGSIQGNQYQVLEGVEPGEEIVVAGVQNLSDGAPIAPESESSPFVTPQ